MHCLVLGCLGYAGEEGDQCYEINESADDGDERTDDVYEEAIGNESYEGKERHEEAIGNESYSGKESHEEAIGFVRQHGSDKAHVHEMQPMWVGAASVECTCRFRSGVL